MSVYLPVSQRRPYADVEGCLVSSFMQGLADIRYIKCTYKVGDKTSFFEKNERDNK